MVAKKHVLVIDDEPQAKMQFRQILEDQGFYVSWYVHWEEVKEKLLPLLEAGAIPDIVLVDMHFFPPYNRLSRNPSLEGVLIIKKFFELCVQYDTVPPPVIGFTGQADYIQKRELIQAGVTDFISAEEFKNPTVLRRRLFQCLQEAFVARILKSPSRQDIYHIEESIVKRVLALNDNDPVKTSQVLHWNIKDVRHVQKRLEEAVHDA